MLKLRRVDDADTADRADSGSDVDAVTSPEQPSQDEEHKDGYGDDDHNRWHDDSWSA